MEVGRIYLIRHGQTAGNGKHYVGWDDLPLNQTGQQQANAIADLLGNKEIDAIYCSALSRAIATAQPLAEQKKLTLTSTNELNEINYGTYQGKLKTELELKLRKNYRHQQLPDGESLHDVYLRVRRFFESIAATLTQQQNLAIVSHYWSIRMFLGILQSKNFDDIFSPGGYKPANGSIYEVCYLSDKPSGIACLSEGYLDTQPVIAKPLAATEVSP